MAAKKKAAAKKAEKELKEEKPKKPKNEGKGKGKGKGEGEKSDEVSFTRSELGTLLLSIAEVSPQGAGSISQAQSDAVRHNLDILFGPEPATIPENETSEGAANV